MEDAFVGQVMTEPVLTIGTETPAAEAGEAMLVEDIKSVVVIDDDCRPEGILTSTDFVQMAADRADPTDATVADYMTEDIVTTGAETSVSEVAETMVEESINHVPVVDGDDRVTGILTTTDIAAYVSDLELAAVTEGLP